MLPVGVCIAKVFHVDVVIIRLCIVRVEVLWCCRCVAVIVGWSFWFCLLSLHIVFIVVADFLSLLSL